MLSTSKKGFFMQKIIILMFMLSLQSFANEKSNDLTDYNNWDKTFIKQLENKKFNTYLQLIRDDFERLNIPADKFNGYVNGLNNAVGCYSEKIKKTYNPKDFGIRYYAKDQALLNDLFLMGRLCIIENANGYEATTVWSDKDKNEFREPIKKETEKLFHKNLENNKAMESELSNNVADCFVKKIEKDFPNHTILIEHYFNGNIQPIEEDLNKYISNTKIECIDITLDKYENSLKKTNSEINFLGKIKQITQQHLIYPKIAILLKQEGAVVVQFFLSKNGNVSELTIIKSSGFDLLDTTALNIIESASSSFPKPPRDMRVKIPIKFDIKNYLKG